MRASHFSLILLIVVFFCTLSLPSYAVVTKSPSFGIVAASAAIQSATGKNSTIQRIRARGDLLVAGVLFDYQPFGYIDEEGEIAGFEVDLVRAMAAQWGIDVQFVPVTPSTRIQSLMAGQVDLVVAAMPHTHDTEALIDFSQSYFSDTPALLMRSDDQVGILDTSTLNTLAGKTIATIQGDGALSQLQTALTNATATTEEPAKILPFQEYSPALLALKAGQADALLAHRTYLTGVARTMVGFTVLAPFPEQQPFGIGVTQGDSYFRNLVDATLFALQQNGNFAELYATWFPIVQPPILEQLPDQWPYTFAAMPPAFAPPPVSRLAQIQKRGKLLVGVAYDLAPFGFVGDQGAIQGFDIDLSREFARRWLGNADALELVRVTPETAIPLLAAGQVDLIAAALPYTWRNRAAIDFSQRYFLDGQSLLVRVDSPLQRLLDLDQKVVAIPSGQTSARDIAALIADTADADISPILLPFQEYQSAQQALVGGQVDALIGSSFVLSQTVQVNRSLRIAVDRFSAQPYAIGIPQFDAPLRDQVNLTLQAMQVDGTYAALYQRWFATEPTPFELWPGLDISTVARGEPAKNQLPTLRPVVVFTPTAVTTAAPLPALAPTRQPLVLVPTRMPISPAIVTAISTTVAALFVAPTVAPTVAPKASPTLSSTLSSTVARLTTAIVINAVPTPVTNPVTNTVVGTIPTLLTVTVTIRPEVNVNARRAPTTTAPVLVVLSGGTNWPFVSISPDGQWVEVQLSAQLTGWVSTLFVLEADFLSSTPTVTPTPSALPSVERATPAATATPRLLFATQITHRVVADDTLASIALRYYEDQSLWLLIYAANREIIGDDPNAIPVGAELVIPPPN